MSHSQNQGWAACCPPITQSLTCSSFSRAAGSRSPVELKSKTRTSGALWEGRGGGENRASHPFSAETCSILPRVPRLPLAQTRRDPYPVQRSPAPPLATVQRLAEPAHAGLHAAGGMRAVQIPGEVPTPQHLRTAQPLGVPKPWGRGARQLSSSCSRAALTHPLPPQSSTRIHNPSTGPSPELSEDLAVLPPITGSQSLASAVGLPHLVESSRQP